MTEKFDDGGPVSQIFQSENILSLGKYQGMTLWDYFAARAMQGIVSVLHEGIRPLDIERMAKDAGIVADAMIAERNRRIKS